MCWCICVSACVRENVCVYVCPTKRNWGSSPRHRQCQEPTTNQLSTPSWPSLSVYFCFATPGSFKLCPVSDRPTLLPLDCHPYPQSHGWPWLSHTSWIVLEHPEVLCPSSTGQPRAPPHPRKRCLDSMKQLSTQHRPPSPWALHLSSLSYRIARVSWRLGLSGKYGWNISKVSE